MTEGSHWLEKPLSISGRMRVVYIGEVLSKVAGTVKWYNVRYEDEDDVLTLNLHEDIDLGDLEVIS